MVGALGVTPCPATDKDGGCDMLTGGAGSVEDLNPKRRLHVCREERPLNQLRQVWMRCLKGQLFQKEI